MTQFLRDEASDSQEVVLPLMLDGTYLSRNFVFLEVLAIIFNHIISNQIKFIWFFICLSITTYTTLIWRSHHDTNNPTGWNLCLVLLNVWSCHWSSWDSDVSYDPNNFRKMWFHFSFLFWFAIRSYPPNLPLPTMEGWPCTRESKQINIQLMTEFLKLSWKQWFLVYL